ncbi:hypothetical protein P8605_39545 [Streptomyces sp. T-3]|nr:hypothetical protein [Streptomyces sp. T-3]
MTTFRQHMEQLALRTLREFPQEAIPDVYAVTFRLDSVDQDPRLPYLAIGYTTESEVTRLMAQPRPPEPWEARWRYAYFPESGLEGIRVAGHDPEHDPAGAELHRQEAVAQGLWYEDDDTDPDDEEDRDERLTEEFRELCVDLARQLQSDGRIAATLGRPLPVILYDMFDPDAMFALTRAANPAELVGEFLSEELR